MTTDAHAPAPYKVGEGHFCTECLRDWPCPTALLAAGVTVHRGVCLRCGSAVLHDNHLRDDLPPCRGHGHPHHGDRCCGPHDHHVTPHRGCILR